MHPSRSSINAGVLAMLLTGCLTMTQADDAPKADIASRLAARSGRSNKGTSFDPKTYLSDLSSEAKQRGFQEFAYKQAPEGELRIYFKMPEGWTANDKRTVMVFFFGGGWSGGSPFACTREAEHFAKSGVVVGLADYRVRNRQGTMLDKCAEDARSAVRWVRANCAKLGADPSRVIVGGGSAGGHIAACTAVADAPNAITDDVKVSCKPDALLLYYPVASLVDGNRSFAFQRLLGNDLARKLSPMQNVTNAWPPTVMFSGTADIELANGVLLCNKAKAAGVNFELYLAEGHGHGVTRTEPRDFAWLDYATDFFMRAGFIEKAPVPGLKDGKLKKYNGEPVDKLATSDARSQDARRQRRMTPDALPSTPAPKPVEEKPKAAESPTPHTETPPTKKGRLLLEETFEGETLSKGWTGKTGGLHVSGGVLHASENKDDGRLGLFNREVAMQDAVIEIDFQFAGARGINIGCNPAPGELNKHGHLFSIMITPRLWNITEHNDKAIPNSRSEALASAGAAFEQGTWYHLVIECKGHDVTASIDGKEPLRCSSSDFGVKKPGIEFRVAGASGQEVLFDNLRVTGLN